MVNDIEVCNTEHGDLSTEYLNPSEILNVLTSYNSKFASILIRNYNPNTQRKDMLEWF